MRFVLFLASCILIPGAAAAGITLAESQPQEGTPVEVVVTNSAGEPAANVKVTALFRPGSDVTSQGTAGTTNASGRLQWTPSEAGLVTLSAEVPGPDGASESLSNTLPISYAKVPGLGLLVMVVAGLILYGGVIYGFKKLSEPLLDFPPDT